MKSRFHPVVILIVLAMAGRAWAVDPATPTPFAVMSPQVVEKLKTLSSTPEAKSVIKKADESLTKEPGPLPRIHVEGTLPHQGIYDESLKATGDWKTILILGMAWQLTHDPKYLQAQEKFLNAWLDTYQISFNPIDETNFDQVIYAYDLTRADLSEATRAKVTKFFRDMSEGYLARIESKKDLGNWQSHRIKLATLTAFSLGDEKLIAKAKDDFNEHLLENIQADGSTFDFHQRDALHYDVYDLEPLTASSLAAKTHGQDWFHAANPNQPSVAMAIDWLIPYAMGEKTHEEFVNSHTKFDAQRAAAGVKGFSGMWDPLHSMGLFEMATMLDPKYKAVSDALAQKGGHPQDWSTLLIQAGI